MESQRAKLLVVLTLLQLCRAEIKDAQPQWYSANIINDGFQPKSISEIFSTEQTFSTATPIIVSSEYGNSYSGEDIALSSPAPPPKFDTTSGLTRQTIASTNPESVAPLQQQYLPHMTTSTQQTPRQVDQTSVEIPQKTSQSDFETTRSLLVSELPPQPQRNVQIQQEQSTSWTFRPSSVTETPTIFQSPITETTLSGQIRYELPETQSTLGPQQMTPAPQQPIHIPNYFLIYQQAPQSIRGIFNPQEVHTFPTSASTTAQDFYTTSSPVTGTFASTQSSTPSTFSTISSTLSTIPSSNPSTIRTSPVLISTTNTPLVTQESSSPTPASAPRVTVTSTSTLGSSSRTSRTTTNRQDCRYLTTPIPSTIITGRPPSIDGILFPLKIKVLSPSGSITNVNINPVNKVPPTTRKPTTTTTRKPTTKRTPKPKKNTYERCLHGCRKHGQNLCAAPLGENPIDPQHLRGFPSVCHMACHNSYRKNAYEKIIDGSCGRLRTRIRPIDSNTKLKKDELHKVQYILDNPGQQKAIVEFTGLYT